MFTLSISPITKFPFKEPLTYWSPERAPEGSIIEINLRNRKELGVVLACNSIEESKQEIKKSNFQTKKIKDIVRLFPFNTTLTNSAIGNAQKYLLPEGTMLNELIPTEARDWMIKQGTAIQEKELKASQELELAQASESPTHTPAPVLKNKETYLLQQSTADRLSTYRSIIREEFAKGESIVIVAPTIQSVINLQKELQRGVEAYTIGLHSSLTKKELHTYLALITDSSHALLVITTPAFFGITTHLKRNPTVIILEEESSRNWKPVAGTQFDWRHLLTTYSNAVAAKFVLADTFLRVETLHRHEEGDYIELTPLVFRPQERPETTLVDMNDPTHKKPDEFKILSLDLISLIKFAIHKKKKIFLFASRKGLSPQTTCGHCGKTVECDDCKAPVVLHQPKDGGDRYFLCHHCGKKRSALESCRNCNSWKLVTLGIGIDTVVAALEKELPKVKVFKIDRESTKTEKQIEKSLEGWQKNESSILVGTEFAIQHIPPVEFASIVSFDSLFSIPDFRAPERIVHIVLDLMHKTKEHLLIQTRQKDLTLLQEITKGTLADFFTREIKLRQELEYPPFRTFIKVSLKGDRSSISQEMSKLQEILAEWNPEVFPAFVPTVGGKSILHMLINIPPRTAPDPRLAHILYSLGSQYEVTIEPESVL